MTKGQIEAEVSNAAVRFQREQHGRGPADVRSYLVGDMLLVRSTGIFTQTESHLVTTDEGRRLIMSARHELRSINVRDMEEIVAGIVGCPVLWSYYDVNVEAAEQVEVYILAATFEDRIRRT
jgi:uncharacterized protein YbcI